MHTPQLLAFCVGRGPLAPGPSVFSLHHFIMIALCPLTLRTPPAPQPGSQHFLDHAAAASAQNEKEAAAADATGCLEPLNSFKGAVVSPPAHPSSNTAAEPPSKYISFPNQHTTPRDGHRPHLLSSPTPPHVTRAALANGIFQKTALLIFILSLLQYPAVYAFLNPGSRTPAEAAPPTHTAATTLSASSIPVAAPFSYSTTTAGLWKSLGLLDSLGRGCSWGVAVWDGVGSCVGRALLAVGMYCVMASLLELSLLSR